MDIFCRTAQRAWKEHFFSNGLSTYLWTNRIKLVCWVLFGFETQYSLDSTICTVLAQIRVDCFRPKFMTALIDCRFVVWWYYILITYLSRELSNHFSSSSTTNGTSSHIILDGEITKIIVIGVHWIWRKMELSECNIREHWGLREDCATAAIWRGFS